MPDNGGLGRRADRRHCDVVGRYAIDSGIGLSIPWINPLECEDRGVSLTLISFVKFQILATMNTDSPLSTVGYKKLSYQQLIDTKDSLLIAYQ